VLKILLLVEACGAGVGRHTLDLARNLAAAHDVHLVYSPRRADRAFLQGVAGLRAHALPMHRGPHPSDIAAGLRLRRYVRHHGPFDIVHAHSTKAGLLMRTALAGLPGARIYTPHAPLTMDPSLGVLRRTALAACERLLALWTGRIISVSQEEFDHLHRLGVPREKLSLVANGIDGAEASSGPDRHPDRPPCVGFLGRLAPQKNLPMLLAAFARADTAQTAVLAIAGAGPMEAALRAEARRLGIASRVRWLGECDAAVLRTFDVFALPSLYEGLAYVLLESMAAGLPVVATRVGGVSLLVEEGRNGFTVPVNDTEGFALALRRLLEDPDLRRRMGAASRERVGAFTVSRMVAGVLGVYKGCIGRRPVPFRKPLINILKSSHGPAD
jgi:glycosyltransferase involved in cell wall biosynthesis